MNTRKSILSQIDCIISENCKDCKTREELIKIDNRNYSKTNAYCISQCSIGLEIQGIGKTLLNRDNFKEKKIR